MSGPASSDLVLSTVVSPDEWVTIDGLAELAGLEVHEFARVAVLASHGGHVARITALEAEVTRLRTASTGETEALARAYEEALAIADTISIRWFRQTGDYKATVSKGRSSRTADADSPAEALTEATLELGDLLAEESAR